MVEDRIEAQHAGYRIYARSHEHIETHTHLHQKERAVDTYSMQNKRKTRLGHPKEKTAARSSQRAD